MTELIPEFTDTNVLVYGHDPTDPTKHEIAKQLINRLAAERRLACSTQILNEFCAVLLRTNRPFFLSAMELQDAIKTIETVSVVYPSSVASLTAALALVGRYKLSIWDTLILAVAKENGVTTIYTEDLPGGIASGQALASVVYVNPFATPAPIIQTA